MMNCYWDVLPASFSFVGDGVRTRPGVHYEQLVGLRVSVHDELDVALVFTATFTANLKYIILVKSCHDNVFH